MNTEPYSTGCPGAEYPAFVPVISMSPSSECNAATAVATCLIGDPIELIISGNITSECSNDLIYINDLDENISMFEESIYQQDDGDGFLFFDKSLPQEIGVQWERKLYQQDGTLSYTVYGTNEVFKED